MHNQRRHSQRCFNFMCGRYTITQDLAELEKLVRFICKVMDFKPRYNVAPRQQAPVFVWENEQGAVRT